MYVDPIIITVKLLISLHVFVGDRAAAPLTINVQIDIDFYLFTADEESIDLSSQLETSINVGEHAFSQMQGDLDQQRLLGERPFNDPLADIMVKEIQHQER